MSFGGSYACKQTTTLASLANFIRGRATKGSSITLPRQKKKSCNRKIGYRIFWRGREDSNFRTGNPAYILSRDASYSLLSTPTRIPLKNGRKPLFTQFALQLYTIFFCLSIVFCFYLKF